jgi:hypothetical protein
VSHLRPTRLADAAARPLDDREQRHVEGCADCRRALDRVQVAQATLRAVADGDTPELSPAALVRAEASIRWTRVSPEPRVRRPFWAALGMAAVGAAAIALVTRAPQPRPRPAPVTIAHVTEPGPVVSGALTAMVTLVGGDVHVLRAGASVPLDLTTRLGAGDLLRTGANARAAAQWSEGSGFLLLGDGELALSRLEPRTQRLALGRGKVAVRVGPHEPGESLQVSTPDHVVSVHGTWFTVAAAEHVTSVEVLEGTVEVRARDGSSSTLLTAPAKAVFGLGRGHTTTMSAHEVARLRAASELNLMALWSTLDAVRAASGALVVSSQPPADLAVDGITLGPTPLSVRRPLGSHYVELARPGFLPSPQWTVVGREPGELRLALPPAPPVADSDSVPIEIESMVRRRATQIRACYERRLKRDPTLAGTVSLRLKVGQAGQVLRASVEDSTLSDAMVGECLRREAAGWSFAVGRNATVVYPFVFRPQ